MNDLFIQPIIFASISLLFVIAIFIYLNKKPELGNNDIELLKENLDSKIEELSSIKNDNANIRADLAAAQSSMQFFTKLEEQYSALELNHEDVKQTLSERSERKIDNSRLSTQVEEKTIRQEQLTDEVSLLTQQVSSLQKNNNLLSNDKAELSEKLKSFNDVQNEFKQLQRAMINKDELITDLKTQLSADKESKKSQQEKIELPQLCLTL